MKVTVALLVIRVALRLVRFRTLSFPLKRKALLNGKTAPEPEHFASLVEIASRYHVLNPSCLEKALVLFCILRRRGIEADLRIGTVLNEAGLQAHAWVKYRDRVILGGAIEGYAPLCSLNTLDQEWLA